MGGAEIEESNHFQKKARNALVDRRRLLAELRPQRNIPFHSAPRHQSRILEDHGNHRLRSLLADEFHGALRRLLQSGKNTEQSSFPASGRPHDPEELAVSDLKINAGKGVDLSLSCDELLTQPVNDNPHRVYWNLKISLKSFTER